MATWNSAVIIDAGKRDGYFYCTIQYSDDTGRVIIKSYTAQNISNAYIESVAQSEIAGFTAADQAVSNTTYRKGSSINLVPSAVTPLTLAQTNQANWLAAYQKVQRYQRAISAGLAGITQQNLTDAQTALNSLVYDSSYESLL